MGSSTGAQSARAGTAPPAAHALRAHEATRSLRARMLAAVSASNHAGSTGADERTSRRRSATAGRTAKRSHEPTASAPPDARDQLGQPDTFDNAGGAALAAMVAPASPTNQPNRFLLHFVAPHARRRRAINHRTGDAHASAERTRVKEHPGRVTAVSVCRACTFGVCCR
jgi:hypothetical protein